MEKIKNAAVELKRLTSGPGHFFFGYYDLEPWDAGERRHLALAVDYMDRLHIAGDAATVGYAQSGQFVRVCETRAWNFQQGSMLRWNPAAPDEEIIYNIEDINGYATEMRSLKTGAVKRLSRPLASVDESGRFGLSVNFARLYNFRPGYGYAGIRDPFFDEPHPDGDGVFLVDMHSGESRLIVSYRRLWECFCQEEPFRSAKLCVNHINFNTDGTRFVMLLRNFPRPGERHLTATLTCGVNGDALCRLTDFTMASHYHWRDPEHLLIYARIGGKDGLFLLRDRTGESQEIDPGFFTFDGHCSYSPDREWLLYDSYPDREGYRALYLYDLKNKKPMLLARLYSDPAASGDFRCDLHPRWSPGGGSITFDSTHEGQRHIYEIDVRGLLER